MTETAEKSQRTVVKRSGFTVNYDRGKIIHAIEGANRECESPMTADDVQRVAAAAESRLGWNVSVETVQDEVEHALMAAGFFQVAKAYIRYRQRHEVRRKAQKQLMNVYHDLFFADAENMDLKRENANINADAPMGVLLKLGTEGAKYYIDNYVLSPEALEADKEGWIHIHDKDLSLLCINCLQIDLLKLFKEGGVNTGHGSLRSPRSVRAAAALGCIILQSNQNDMLGGQSINCWDYAMAYGVRYSFAKAILANTRRAAAFMNQPMNDATAELMKDTLYADTCSTVRYAETKEGISAQTNILRGVLTQFAPTLVTHADKIYRISCSDVEDETKQAMEAAVHNLNSMHCLPGSEQIWVYDNSKHCSCLMTVADLVNTFAMGRYMAISLNRETGKPEWKAITAVQHAGHGRRLVKVVDKAGQTLTTTDNHKWMYLNNTGVVDETFPEQLPHTLTPTSFDTIAGVKVDTEYNMVKYDERGVYASTPFKDDVLKVTQDLAVVFGMFVADGSTSDGTSSLSFTVCDAALEQELMERCTRVFGQDVTYDHVTYDNGKPKSLIVNVGRRVVRLFRDVCKTSSHNARVPDEIFLGTRELKLAFIDGYVRCDGSLKNRFVDCSTVSKTLQKQLHMMFLSLGELSHVTDFEHTTSYGHTHAYTCGLTAYAAQRVGIQHDFDVTRAEIAKYDYSFLYDLAFRNYTGKRPKRSHMTRETVAELCENGRLASRCMNLLPVSVQTCTVIEDNDEDVYDITVADNETFLTADGIFVHNSRAGAQTPFSSLNYGMDVSPEGRLVTKMTLLAVDAGLGHGETAIFPISVFQLKAGVNYNPEDVNYDLFKLACKVSAKRLFPNFVSLDAPYNIPYYKEGDYNSYVATMGCRTRVMSNVNGPEESGRRGNFSFVSVNLPMLALEAKGDQTVFFNLLDKYMDIAHDYLLSRYEIIAEKHVYNFPFLMGQHLWMGSENLRWTDTIRDVLKHASLSIGFVGLAEALIALIGKHHGESDEAQQLGLKIIGHMRQRTDDYTEAEHMNWSTFATPAESTAGSMLRATRKKFGVVPRVTEHEYFTNSNHVPVYCKCTAAHKVEVEAPYHALTNAGHIMYIEIDGDPTQNLEAFETLVRLMHDKGAGYFSINHSVDICPACGYTGIIYDECPQCGHKEIPATRIHMHRVCC